MSKEKFDFKLDGVLTPMTLKEAENYNVIVNKSNGYSHDYVAIEKFDAKLHYRTQYCNIFRRNFTYLSDNLTTKEITSFVVGTSAVTFS